jgi:hypothetical protein
MGQEDTQAQPAGSEPTNPPAGGSYGVGTLVTVAVVSAAVGVAVGRKIGQDKKPDDDRKICQD